MEVVNVEYRVPCALCNLMSKNRRWLAPLRPLQVSENKRDSAAEVATRRAGERSVSVKMRVSVKIFMLLLNVRAQDSSVRLYRDE